MPALRGLTSPSRRTGSLAVAWMLVVALATSGLWASSAAAEPAWTTVASMPTPRAELAGVAAPCPSDQSATCVYAIGGITTSALLGTVEAYAPASNTWTTATAMSTARFALAAAAGPCPLDQGRACVYAIGGHAPGNAIVGLVEANHPATNTWSPVAPMPTARRYLAATTAPCPSEPAATCIYAMGGDNGRG